VRKRGKREAGGRVDIVDSVDGVDRMEEESSFGETTGKMPVPPGLLSPQI